MISNHVIIDYSRSCLAGHSVVDSGTAIAPKSPVCSSCRLQGSSRPNLKLLYVSPPLELELPPQQLHKAPMLAVLVCVQRNVNFQVLATHSTTPAFFQVSSIG